ncbi:MAG: 30S ribosomal protein S17 [Thermoanaerobaculales bacterium]|jgi:small subunit ribosomal protein S17|nr:30S ribosomal protein S17 [Thermoanaerobaculales bacterium]
MTDTAKTARKTTKVGLVLSAAADKSVVVKVENFVMHPLYHRFVRSTSKFMAHDETNTCNKGDRVLIEECRPLSRRKKWRVRKVIERAQ